MWQWEGEGPGKGFAWDGQAGLGHSPWEAGGLPTKKGGLQGGSNALRLDSLSELLITPTHESRTLNPTP